MELAEKLAALPRFEPSTLEITPVPEADAADDIKQMLSHLTLKVFTGDPFEGERDTDWVFAANRTVPGHQLIIYLSAGYGELAAEQIGWEAVLREAAGRGLALWQTYPGPVSKGHLTVDPVAADLPEPVDPHISGFTAAEWRRGDFGFAVDLAEIEAHQIAFDPVITEPEVTDQPDPECPACGSELLLLVHMPDGYLDSLCPQHRDQHNIDQADARVGAEAFSMVGTVMVAMLPDLGGAVATGFWERVRLADESSEPLDKASFLEWIVSAFAGHREAFMIVMGFDQQADVVYRSVHDVADLDPGRAIELGSKLADLATPSQRWLFEMTYVDALREVGKTEEASSIVAGWEERARTEPFLYMPVGDTYREWGELEAAHDAYTKMYGTSVMAGVEHNATYALHQIKEVARELGRRERAAEAIALLGLIESQGVGQLKRGRNEPCICGSGAKTKRCCGGIRRH